MFAPRRLTALVVGALAAFSAIGPAASAATGTSTGTSTSTSTSTGTGTEIFPGWAILDATVTGICPGPPTPRHMSAEHAAAFMQSWYIATLYNGLDKVGPPAASLPRCTFKANDRINGASFTFTAFYVTDGKQAWVGLPKQIIGPGADVPDEAWFVAPPRAIVGIRGELNPVPTTLPATTTPTTTPTTVAKADGSSGSSAGWIVGGFALAILLGAVIALVARTRRRASSA